MPYFGKISEEDIQFATPGHGNASGETFLRRSRVHPESFIERHSLDAKQIPCRYEESYVEDFALANTVNANAYSSLDEAISAIGSDNKTLLISKNIPVSDNLTIPSNITLKFTYPGKITIPSSKTLTVNSRIIAGLWQIFDGDGTVAGTPKISIAYPDWFNGVDVGDKIIKAANFVPKYGIVVISPTIWNEANYSTPIDVLRGVYLKFPGVRAKANFLGTGFALRLSNLVGCVIDGFAVDLGSNTNADVDGVILSESHDNVFLNGLCIENAVRHGLVIDGGDNGAYQNVFSGVVRIQGSGGNNIKITTSGSSMPNANSFYRVVLGACSSESLLIESGLNNCFHGVYIQSGSSWAIKKTSLYTVYFDYLVIDSDMNYGISTSYPIFCGILENYAATPFDGGSEAHILYSTGNRLYGKIAVQSMFFQNISEGYAKGEAPYIHSTTDGGASYPFKEYGNLVIEGRYGTNKRDIVFVNNGEITAVFDRYGKVNIYKKIRNVNIITFADGDTTPSVLESNIFKTNNSSATSITTLDDGSPGQKITVIFGDSNTTIVHGSGIILNGGTNVTPSANSVMEFVYDGTEWYETSRNF